MDWNAVDEVIKRKKVSCSAGCRAADSWSVELDRILAPCERAAEDAGYLMTPVLVVDGKVVHHGSVPAQQDVKEWLSD